MEMINRYFEKYGGKEFLIIPSPPTPNGGLHIGHIAGPYLRGDIYKRFLELFGALPKMISGIDAFDLYISSKAKQDKLSEEELVNTYYKAISADLSYANIEMDAFINPLEYRSGIEKILNEKYEYLFNSSKASIVNRRLPVSQDDEFLLYPDLISDCVHCGEEIGGNCCENCGGVFNTFNLQNIRTMDGQSILKEECQVEVNYDLELKDFYTKRNLQRLIYKTLECYVLNVSCKNVVLTHHFSWGLNLKFNHNNFKALTYTNRFFFNIFYGELYKRMTNSIHNPYDKMSNVKIVSFFGKDNIVSNILLKYVIKEQFNDLKIEDHFVANDFYLLEGKKFSTSRKHNLNLKDVVDKYGYTVDQIRYYLTLTSPSNNEADFSIDSLKAVIDLRINSIYSAVQSSLLNLLSQNEIVKIPDFYLNIFWGLIERQEKALSPDDFKPELLPAIIDEWIKIRNDDMTHQFWLSGISLLIYPVMPVWAIDIWNQCNEQTLSFESFYRTYVKKQ